MSANPSPTTSTPAKKQANRKRTRVEDPLEKQMMVNNLINAFQTTSLLFQKVLGNKKGEAASIDAQKERMASVVSHLSDNGYGGAVGPCMELLELIGIAVERPEGLLNHEVVHDQNAAPPAKKTPAARKSRAQNPGQRGRGRGKFPRIPVSTNDDEYAPDYDHTGRDHLAEQRAAEVGELAAVESTFTQVPTTPIQLPFQIPPDVKPCRATLDRQREAQAQKRIPTEREINRDVLDLLMASAVRVPVSSNVAPRARVEEQVEPMETIRETLARARATSEAPRDEMEQNEQDASNYEMPPSPPPAPIEPEPIMDDEPAPARSRRSSAPREPEPEPQDMPDSTVSPPVEPTDDEPAPRATEPEPVEDEYIPLSRPRRSKIAAPEPRASEPEVENEQDDDDAIPLSRPRPVKQNEQFVRPAVPRHQKIAALRELGSRRAPEPRASEPRPSDPELEPRRRRSDSQRLAPGAGPSAEATPNGSRQPSPKRLRSCLKSPAVERPTSSSNSGEGPSSSRAISPSRLRTPKNEPSTSTRRDPPLWTGSLEDTPRPFRHLIKSEPRSPSPPPRRSKTPQTTDRSIDVASGKVVGKQQNAPKKFFLDPPGEDVFSPPPQSPPSTTSDRDARESLVKGVTEDMIRAKNMIAGMELRPIRKSRRKSSGVVEPASPEKEPEEPELLAEPTEDMDTTEPIYLDDSPCDLPPTVPHKPIVFPPNYQGILPTSGHREHVKREPEPEVFRRNYQMIMKMEPGVVKSELEERELEEPKFEEQELEEPEPEEPEPEKQEPEQQEYIVLDDSPYDLPPTVPHEPIVVDLEDEDLSAPINRAEEITDESHIEQMRMWEYPVPPPFPEYDGTPKDLQSPKNKLDAIKAIQSRILEIPSIIIRVDRLNGGYISWQQHVDTAKSLKTMSIFYRGFHIRNLTAESIKKMTKLQKNSRNDRENFPFALFKDAADFRKQLNELGEVAKGDNYADLPKNMKETFEQLAMFAIMTHPRAEICEKDNIPFAREVMQMMRSKGWVNGLYDDNLIGMRNEKPVSFYKTNFLGFGVPSEMIPHFPRIYGLPEPPKSRQ